jgi:hypothetical protein
MGTPLGFSIGDIIVGIGVIKTSIGVFSSTRRATNNHKLLSTTLTQLYESSGAVRVIDIDRVHDAQQREALRQAVQHCQTCIDRFVERIAKYKVIQPSTQLNVWNDNFKKAARKIQWALCEEADISKFQGDIQLQLDAINILLVSLQM